MLGLYNKHTQNAILRRRSSFHSTNDRTGHVKATMDVYTIYVGGRSVICAHHYLCIAE